MKRSALLLVRGTYGLRLMRQSPSVEQDLLNIMRRSYFIVRHASPHGDAEHLVKPKSLWMESNNTLLAFVGEDLSECDVAGVVDGRMYKLPTRAAQISPAVAMRAVAGLIEPHQLHVSICSNSPDFPTDSNTEAAGYPATSAGS